MAQQKRK